ncbi:MAG: T9SS type A sorting domain-containing protein [Chitinophagales bacterium]
MKKILLLTILSCCIFNVIDAQNACSQKRSAHIRIVGDSWAHFPTIYESYDSALAKYGFADYYSIGDGSVLISMTAETWWQFPLARFALEAALGSDAVRPIDIIMVSLGGNDVAFGMHSGDSLNVLDNDLQEARLFMDSIFDYIHSVYPNGQIFWQSYDYPNFNDPCLNVPWNPYCDLWEDKGYPTPYELNRMMGYMTDFQDTVVQGYNARGKDYMHFYNLLGLMQWRYGQLTPLRYPPYGTYPPRSVPLPYGNINYPTPLPAMGLLNNDTYHLGPQSFTYLAEAYMRKFISNYFRRFRDTTFYSSGQNYDGWISENNVSGIGDVLVGKRNAQNTKGIFSFNTADIPDNKIIKRASLFLKCKDIKTIYPMGTTFPQIFQLDIKQGSFGNPTIESSDFNADASMNDVACFAGRLRGVDYALRADLTEDALQYINKTGLTQFRLTLNDDNLITFFNGDTTAFEGPYLDVYYDSTELVTAIRPQKNIEQTLTIFPNPATNTISVDLNKYWINKQATLSIYNVEGKLVNSQTITSNHAQQIPIDISSLAEGSYILGIENEQQNSVGTFVKMK